MRQEEVERLLMQALQTLYAENLQILRLDVAERAICAQLSRILQRSFEQHAVHAEYNRHGVEPKIIELPDANGRLKRNRVSPDIVVHQPGHDEQNILVIEVKKTTNAVPDRADLAKLEQIKRQIGYQHAVFLRLPTGVGADACDIRRVWV